MRKYLLINAIWFSLLLFAPLYGAKISRLFLAVFLCVVMSFFWVKEILDPYAFLAYFVFSILTFRVGVSFREWATAKSHFLDDALNHFSKELQSQTSVLETKSKEAQLAQAQFDEVTYLYNTIKEMSQSLDIFETFLIFGEALSAHFDFDSIKLAVLDEEEKTPNGPVAFYELRCRDFKNLIDKGIFLESKSRAKASPDAIDKRILYEVRNLKKPLAQNSDGSFMAYPIFIHHKLFAVLILFGVKQKDVLALSLLIERFISELERVKLYATIGTLAITDGLTGVYVRRHLLERLKTEFERAKRMTLPLSYLMIDIDHFKDFNDRYGHLVGDVVLKKVAETIKKNIRELDMAARVGGEEFAVLLIETDESRAFFVAERIRLSICESNFKAYDENLKVTVSIGCSTYSDTLNTEGKLTESADAALYQAKRQSRNRVCSYNLSDK